MSTTAIPGVTSAYQDLAQSYSDMHIARVVAQYKDYCRAICESGEVLAQISGKLRHTAACAADFPAVGDFVMLKMSGVNSAVIHIVLPRHSVFSRKAAGTKDSEQIVAANIDTVFICMAMDRDYNLRRLERYLSVSWSSGATPVVILTKADIAQDLAAQQRDAQDAAVGAHVIVTSSMLGDGMDALNRYLQRGKTVAFIGSSGVGKSTLINRLAGEALAATGDVRADGKGRHTTTSRELMVLSSGAIVIDTPGMRELGIDFADLSRSFADIDALAQQCRFSDCKHSSEPGCAVRAAIEDGSLDEARLTSYSKLKKEAKYDGLNFRQIENEKLSEMFKDVGGIKNVRKFIRENDKRR